MSDDKGRQGWREWVTMTAAIISALGWMGTALWQGSQEQGQWERDAREQAYAEFYGALQTENDRRMSCEEGGKTPEADLSKIRETMLGIRFYGSIDTYQSAIEAVQVVSGMECSGPIDVGRKTDTLGPIDSLVESMRKDLGID